MTNTTRVSVAVAVVAGAFVLASCSPGDLLDSAIEKGVEKGFEAATGTDIEIDEDGGQISISGEDGDVTFGSGAGLPDGFPDEIPLVDGEITGGMRISEGDTDGFMASVATSGSIGDVYDQATGLLEGAGFTEQSSADMGGMRTVVYEPNGAIVSLGVNFIEDTDQGVVNVSYTLSKEK